MSLLTADDVIAAGADGGLSADTLDTLIAREEAMMIAAIGDHFADDTPLTATLRGGKPSVYLPRLLTSVSSVKEYAALGDTAYVTLTTADYYVWPDQGRIVRLPEGAHWLPLVVVQYIPADDTPARTAVLLELVRLAAVQTAAGASETTTISASQGAASKTVARGAPQALSVGSWERARAALYGRLLLPGVS